MTTISCIATKPNVKNIVVPDYDFVRQISGIDPLLMAWTSSSQQTFDYRGQPQDVRDDNND